MQGLQFAFANTKEYTGHSDRAISLIHPYPDGSKWIIIDKRLEGAPLGYPNAIADHERVHLKRGDYFLHDGLERDVGTARQKVPELLRKYKMEDLESQLNACDTQCDFCVWYIASHLSQFHKDCVNIIAWYEETDEEIRNWIATLGFI